MYEFYFWNYKRTFDSKYFDVISISMDECKTDLEKILKENIKNK